MNCLQDLDESFLFFSFFFFKEGEREGEKHQCVGVPLTRNLARNPGMSPDGESNLQASGTQVHAQSTELH